jgi:hypothetical protein
MLNTITPWGELFHTPTGAAYADIPVGLSPGNLADPQPTLSQLVAALPL